MKTLNCLSALAILLFGVQAAHAAISISLMEVGPDVVATGSGSVNLSGLTQGASNNAFRAIRPSSGYLSIGSGSSLSSTDVYTSVSGPASFGPGNLLEVPTSTSGNNFAIGIDHDIRLPVGYVSNTPLSFGATWENASFDSLGVTPGIYTWTWGSDANADSATMTATVPEPGIYASIAGVLALGIAIWRRRRG